MSQINRAGQPNSAGHRDITQGSIRKQLDAITDSIRQLAGNPEVGPTSAEDRSPLNSPFVLYVNGIIGSDKYVAGDYASFDDGSFEAKMRRISLQRLECGYTAARPFKTINRACIEAALISSRDYLDLSPAPCGDLISIVIAPGIYDLINDPGGSVDDEWTDGMTPDANELKKFNDPNGGVIVPRGASICSLDLRKTIIRPTYVPAVADEQPDFSTRSAILRMTGTGYFYGFTFMDKKNSNESHHLLDCFQFTAKADLDNFYAKIRTALKDTADIDTSFAVSRSTEWQIVGPQPDSGQTSTTDTVGSASPYIYNISIRSRYGLCGLFADGAVAGGFRSCVLAQFTGTSLQTDMRCWQKYQGGSWVNYAQNEYGNYISRDPNNVRMDPDRRSVHIRAVNDAIIQEVSIFAIGTGIHHEARSGAQISITNSNSNFGGCAALAHGFQSSAAPGDTPWDLLNVRRAVDPLSKSNITARISLSVAASQSGTTLRLEEPLNASPIVDNQPNILAKDDYSLKGGDLIWADEPSIPGGNYYATLASSPWDSSDPTKINITGSWKIISSNTDYNGLAPGDSVPGSDIAGDTFPVISGQVIYVRRVKDIRSVDERRFSILLDGDSGSRLPNRDYVLQSLSTSNDADTAVSVTRAAPTKDGDVGSNGVEVELRPTMRPDADANHDAGTYYRKGDVVRKNNKHFSAGTAQLGNFDDGVWNEIYVHMEETYVADSSIKNAQPVLVFNSDTDAADDQCGVSMADSIIQAQLKSGTDYMGLEYFLNANTNVTNKGACLSLVNADDRIVDPSPSSNRVEFRRPSNIRLFGHAWEWSGFLNYTKALPDYQGTLSPTNKFSYYFTNQSGGKVYASGFNEEGYVVTPQGLQDITTGEVIDAEDIAAPDIDSNDAYTSLTVGQLTVTDQLILESGAEQAFLATTQKPGIVELMKVPGAAKQFKSSGVEDPRESVTQYSLEQYLSRAGYAKAPGGLIANVVLHVAKDGVDSGLSQDDSIPDGFEVGSTSSGYGSEAYKEFQPGGLFKTVGEACEAAQSIFIPAGAELIISVHNDLDELESEPIIISNSKQKFVVAGARGATNPKIYIKSGYGNEAIKRLPNFSNANIASVGAIYQGLTIDFDTAQTRDATLVLDGGLGVDSKRDTVVNALNCAKNAEITCLTGSVGGSVDLRVTAKTGLVLENGDSERALLLAMFYDDPGEEVDAGSGMTLFGNGAGQGLTGHNLRMIVDFRDIPWGDTDKPDFVFKWTHNLTNVSTKPRATAVDLGNRGGCTTGSRVGPQVIFDFNGNNWNLDNFIGEEWRENANQQGQSFNCKQVRNFKNADATALLPKNRTAAERIVFNCGAILTPNFDTDDVDTFNGGFASMWKWIENDLGVNGTGDNKDEFIMLFDTDKGSGCYTQGSNGKDRSLAAYGG